MSRPWVYLRLREHVHAERARQVTRGKWRATDPHLPPTAGADVKTDVDAESPPDREPG